MAIDDVQYLIENSEEDSIRLFIDSANRNYEFYPEPSEYVVPFEEPIRNVFGINILDAAIPSSMFNIEHFNNQFKLILLRRPLGSPAPPDMPPSSADAPHPQDILEELGSMHKLRAYLDALNPRLVVVPSAVQYAQARDTGGYAPSLHSDEAINPRYATTAPAALLVRRLERVPLNLAVTDAHRRSPDYVVLSLHDDNEYVARRYGPTGAVAERLADPQGLWVFLGRVPGAARPWAEHYFALYDVVPLASVDEARAYESGGHGFHVAIESINYYLQPANYGLQELLTRLPDLIGPDGYEIEGQGDFVPQTTFRMTLSNEVQFAADMENSRAREILGYDLHAKYGERRQLGGFRAVRYGRNKRYFMSEYDAGSGTWKMTSPGIINLQGDTYVKLRCPEIEDFLSSGAGFGSYYPGLVVFKLAGGNMVTHLRFDFVNLKTKKIHPIGKLHRLTFRFERSNGELYDFKGANHRFLMSVDHWVPTPKLSFKGSVLNPEYDANFLRYQLNQYAHPEDPAVREAYDHPALTSSGLRGGLGSDDGNSSEEDGDKKKVDDAQYDYTTDGSFEEYVRDPDVLGA